LRRFFYDFFNKFVEALFVAHCIHFRRAKIQVKEVPVMGYFASQQPVHIHFHRIIKHCCRILVEHPLNSAEISQDFIVK